MAVVDAARLVRYKTKALREALHALDASKACKHLNATRIARSNAGNYDPSSDRCWWECSCPDCGYGWTVPQ